MKVFRFYKFFNMKNCETINSSVVLIDKNNIVINNLANTTQQPIQINNPFTDLANKLVLNNAYNADFQQIQNINNDINKIFTSEKYDVNYNLFPARFQIISKKKEDKFLEQTLSLIQKANIGNNIGRIGFNFALFSTELEGIKKKILKDDFAKNYNGFSITFSQDINEDCKLTIKLYEAIKNNQQQEKGVLIDANFEQIINQENTINKAFNEDYSKLVEDYIKNIF